MNNGRSAFMVFLFMQNQTHEASVERRKGGGQNRKFLLNQLWLTTVTLLAQPFKYLSPFLFKLSVTFFFSIRHDVKINSIFRKPVCLTVIVLNCIFPHIWIAQVKMLCNSATQLGTGTSVHSVGLCTITNLFRIYS